MLSVVCPSLYDVFVGSHHCYMGGCNPRTAHAMVSRDAVSTGSSPHSLGPSHLIVPWPGPLVPGPRMAGDGADHTVDSLPIPEWRVSFRGRLKPQDSPRHAVKGCGTDRSSSHVPGPLSNGQLAGR